MSIFWISLAKPTSGHIPGGIFSGAALVWRGMAWLGVRGGGGAWHGDMAWGAWWAGAWQGMTGRGGVGCSGKPDCPVCVSVASERLARGPRC